MEAWAVFPDTPTRSAQLCVGPARQGKLLLPLPLHVVLAGRVPANHSARQPRCPAPQLSRLARVRSWLSWGLHKNPRPSLPFRSVKWGEVCVHRAQA